MPNLPAEVARRGGVQHYLLKNTYQICQRRVGKITEGLDELSGQGQQAGFVGTRTKEQSAALSAPHLNKDTRARTPS